MTAKAMPKMTGETALVPLGKDRLQKRDSSEARLVSPDDCVTFCCSYVGQGWDLYCNGIYEGTFYCPDTSCYQYCC
jgi:hypothetical protein